MLEMAVTEAQSSESRVSNLQLWIYQVDRMLNEFYENDTTIEDLPHDFQVRCTIFLDCLCLLEHVLVCASLLLSPDCSNFKIPHLQGNSFEVSLISISCDRI